MTLLAQKIASEIVPSVPFSFFSAELRRNRDTEVARIAQIISKAIEPLEGGLRDAVKVLELNLESMACNCSADEAPVDDCDCSGCEIARTTATVMRDLKRLAPALHALKEGRGSI
jgi:hypothetical protein